MHQQPLQLQEAYLHRSNEYQYKSSQFDNYIVQQVSDKHEMHHLIEFDQFFSLLLKLGE